MRVGRTRSARKAVDLEEGAVVGVPVQSAHAGNTTTMVETLLTAAERVDAVLPPRVGIAEVVGDKGQCCPWYGVVLLSLLGSGRDATGQTPWP